MISNVAKSGQQQCENCKFCREAASDERAVAGEFGFVLECRRNPPVIVARSRPFGDEGTFPVVRPYHWCGDWERSEYNQEAIVITLANGSA